MQPLRESLIKPIVIVAYLILAIIASICFCDGLDALYEDTSNQPTIEVCGNLSNNAVITQNIPIGTGISHALFFLNWTDNQSIFEFNLIAPNGERIVPNSKGIDHSSGDAVDYYSLPAPEAGIWTVEIRAVDLKENQEGYCLLVDRYSENPVKHNVKFNGLYSDDLTDRDHDGFYDTISVKVGIDVRVPGIYTLTGSLFDLDGTETQVSNQIYLDIGAQRAILEFYGINATGRKRIGNLTLYDMLESPVDHVEDARMTKGYDNTQQEIQMASLTGNYSDRGIDTDGDGFYDFLNVEVGVDVLTSGEYTLSAILYSMKGDEIAWSIDHSRLSPGYYTMQLDFDGKSIWTQGIDGPFIVKDLMLSGSNWSLNDLEPEAYVTSAYNAVQFVDPIYPEKVISGSGSGEMIMTFVIEEVLPVFSGRYSQDIVGINMPPISSPFRVNGSTSGYAYDAEGIYIPGKPNDFTVTADGVKNLNIGLRKDPAKSGINATRTWVTTQIDASPDGRAVAKTDLVSPGSYHVKIFGDATDNATEVNLVLTVAKKILVDGKFNLSINTTGFPPGNYSMAARAVNGSFEFSELSIGSLL